VVPMFRAEYRRLARQEARNGTVIHFRNDAPIDEAITVLASLLDSRGASSQSAPSHSKRTSGARTRGRE
jgi:hypothetical protein